MAGVGAPTAGSSFQGPGKATAPPGYHIAYGPGGGQSLERDPLAAGFDAGNARGSAISALSPSLAGLLSSLGISTATPGGGTPPANGGAPSMGNVANISTSAVAPVDMTTANEATFGAAKDQAGQTGRSEIDSMNGLLGATGQLGGGAQAAGTRDVVEKAGQTVNDITRQNAVTKAGSDLSVAQGNQANARDVALANQQTQLSQRGQDLSAQQAQAQLAMEQAQQNSQRQLQLLQSVLGFAGDATKGVGQY